MVPSARGDGRLQLGLPGCPRKSFLRRAARRASPPCMGLVPVDRSSLPDYTFHWVIWVFMRNLPSLVIVLIFANPILCQMLGFCEAAPSGDCRKCCASCMGEGDAGSREREPSDGPRESREAPAKPCNSPGDSYCQCLRAGAVIQEAPSLDDSQDGFTIDRIRAVLSCARPTLCLVPDRFGERFPRGKANPGRIARCLYMSFLC